MPRICRGSAKNFFCAHNLLFLNKFKKSTVKDQLNEFYRVAFRKKLYRDLETLQIDLDEYMDEYNTKRTHQGKRCKGRTPLETFIEGKQLYNEKNLGKIVAA